MSFLPTEESSSSVWRRICFVHLLLLFVYCKALRARVEWKTLYQIKLWCCNMLWAFVGGSRGHFQQPTLKRGWQVAAASQCVPIPALRAELALGSSSVPAGNPQSIWVAWREHWRKRNLYLRVKRGKGARTAHLSTEGRRSLQRCCQPSAGAEQQQFPPRVGSESLTSCHRLPGKGEACSR